MYEYINGSHLCIKHCVDNSSVGGGHTYLKRVIYLLLSYSDYIIVKSSCQAFPQQQSLYFQ